VPMISSIFIALGSLLTATWPEVVQGQERTVSQFCCVFYRSFNLL